MKDRVIHPKTIDKTIRRAKKDLESNMNVITASAIIIISQLGLRLSELLSIKEDCVQMISGDKMLRYETAKLKKERVEVTKPMNSLAYYAINKLKDSTQQLRKESGLPFLFVNRARNVKGQPPGLISQANFNKNFLRPWIEKHNLTYEDGSLIDFTSHTFRHSFATYALQSGASIETISDILNHRSIRGTQYYTHLLEEQVKERFAEVLSEGAVITGKKALTIKDRLKEDNPFKGKTVEQVDKIRKAMKIQVLSHGLCLHHPMRNEPCEGDGVCLGCNNFITTPDFLEVHKGRLKRVRVKLDKIVVEGADGPFESKLRHIESYLVDIINDLETQLEYRGKEDNADYIS